MKSGFTCCPYLYTIVEINVHIELQKHPIFLVDRVGCQRFFQKPILSTYLWWCIFFVVFDSRLGFVDLILKSG